jgi:hypothetical protein
MTKTILVNVGMFNETHKDTTKQKLLTRVKNQLYPYIHFVPNLSHSDAERK